jgi:two-component system, NarL family, response regulator NreC
VSPDQGEDMPRIVIADDHSVTRTGVRALINTVDGWEVVGDATDGFQVLPLIEEKCPDLVILDLSMPNLGGIETLLRLKRMKVRPAVLVLSARDDECSVAEAMKAGANGFVPKTCDADELLFAVRSLLKGQSYLSPSVAGSVLARDPQSSEPITSPLSTLTSREREVMKLLSEGKPNRDVAKLLHISTRTIDTHRANIMKKLGLQSNAEMVQMAIRHGLVEHN